MYYSVQYAIYCLSLWLLYPLVFLRFRWKGRRFPDYTQRLAERRGPLPDARPVDIWIHAVSLGEVIAVTPLIQKLLSEGYSLLVTTTTATGSERVLSRFGQQIQHQYLPYDFPSYMRSMLRAYTPKLVLLMETEWWPSLILEVSRRDIPLCLVNGRLSARSLKQYKKIRFFMKPLLRSFQRILAQAPESAARMQELGALPAKIEVVGNIKFDLEIPSTEGARAIQQHWGADRLVVIVGSTHEGEESQILEQWRKVQAALPHVLLIIAPRHPERFERVLRLSEDAGFKTARYTQPEGVHKDTEVFIIDAIGQLLAFYGVSQHAFVGGSWAPIGGHNTLEPLAMGALVYTGKHTHNFAAIQDALMEAGGIQVAPDAAVWADQLIDTQRDSQRQKSLRQGSQLVLQTHQGALLRTYEALLPFLKRT